MVVTLLEALVVLLQRRATLSSHRSNGMQGATVRKGGAQPIVEKMCTTVEEQMGSVGESEVLSLAV